MSLITAARTTILDATPLQETEDGHGLPPQAHGLGFPNG